VSVERWLRSLERRVAEAAPESCPACAGRPQIAIVMPADPEPEACARCGRVPQVIEIVYSPVRPPEGAA
jgi:hypothetical protein